VDAKRGADGDWVTWRSTRSRGDDDEEGETEDQLSHRCKYDGEHRCARVRVETLTGTTKKKTKKNKRPTDPVQEKQKDEPSGAG
jgi:hypothetical protein